jgi:hypothetical protein
MITSVSSGRSSIAMPVRAFTWLLFNSSTRALAAFVAVLCFLVNSSIAEGLPYGMPLGPGKSTSTPSRNGIGMDVSLPPTESCTTTSGFINLAIIRTGQPARYATALSCPANLHASDSPRLYIFTLNFGNDCFSLSPIAFCPINMRGEIAASILTRSVRSDSNWLSVVRFCSCSRSAFRLASADISSDRLLAAAIFSLDSDRTRSIWICASAWTCAMRSSLWLNSSLSKSSLARMTALFDFSNASACVLAFHCTMNVTATAIALTNTQYMYALFHWWKDFDKREASSRADWIGCILRILVIFLYGIVIPVLCVVTIIRNRRRSKGQSIE